MSTEATHLTEQDWQPHWATLLDPFPCVIHAVFSGAVINP